MLNVCKCGCGEKVKKGNIYRHGHNRRNLISYTKNKKWSMKHEKCVKCNTVDIKHAGKGLCKKCYKKQFYESSKNKERWSKKHNSCIICKRTDRPHKSKGLCGTCYVNNVNRKKGIKKRNFGHWSWYYDECVNCGTNEKSYSAKGLCYDCYEEQKRSKHRHLLNCPVCGVKVIKVNQHLSMKAKKCNKHKEYQYNLFKIYFYSDLNLDDISNEIGVDRHSITKQFVKFFGKKATEERNEMVRRCNISEKAKINFNNKNRFGKVVIYNSKNNGVVSFRSKLERDYATHLDKSGVLWKYESKSFPYIGKDGRRHTYTPDFYLVGSNIYIEVKGYEQSDCFYKINQLRKKGIKIKVVKREDFMEV